MYVEAGVEKDVQSWINTVHGLRYKDYQLIASASAAAEKVVPAKESGLLDEVNTVKDFAAEMERKGTLRWWRIAMGYVHD